MAEEQIPRKIFHKNKYELDSNSQPVRLRYCDLTTTLLKHHVYMIRKTNKGLQVLTRLVYMRQTIAPIHIDTRISRPVTRQELRYKKVQLFW